MTRTKAWVAATAALCVGLSALAWFLLVSPQRAAAAQAQEATLAAQQENTTLRATIDRLRVEYAELPAREEDLLAIRAALPDEPALDDALAEVSAAARNAGVTLTGMTAASAQPIGATADGGTTTDSTTGTTTDAQVSLLVAGSADAAQAPVAGSPEATEPGAAPSGPTGTVFARIPVTLSVTGDFFAVEAFVKTLQTDLVRSLLLSSVAVAEQGDSNPGLVSGELTGDLFVYVDQEAWDRRDRSAGAQGAVAQ